APGSAFGRPQVDAPASLLLALHNKALLVDEMLWGLWLFPLGALQLRSGFVPRVVGVLAIVAGAGYVLDFAISLVVPDAANSLASVVSLAQAGELATVVWLLATRGHTRGPGAEPARIVEFQNLGARPSQRTSAEVPVRRKTTAEPLGVTLFGEGVAGSVVAVGTARDGGLMRAADGSWRLSLHVADRWRH